MKQFIGLPRKLMAFAYYIIFHPVVSWRVFSLRTKRRIIKVLAVILIIVIATPVSIWYAFYRGANEAEAAWWNDLWLYRKAITVTNSSGGELTAFQVKILDNKDLSADVTAGKIQADLDDLRFTDINGNVLPYWIEDSTAASVDIWIKAPILPTTGATIYMYYGNAQATAVSSGNKVFEFFDDFSSSAIDSDKWTQGTIAATSGTDFSISDGKLTGGNSNRYIQSKSTFTGNYTAMARMYNTTAVVNGFTAVSFYSSASNTFGILDHNGTSYTRNDSAWVNFSFNGNSQWSRNSVSINGTSAVYSRVGETSGSASNTLVNSGISGEYLRLGARGDDGAYDQNYSAQWDWIYVRKCASTDPSSGAPGSEQKGTAPVAYWSFDEGTGTTAQDGTANNDDGTLTNMSATSDPNSGWQPADKCVSGKCVAFDGTNDYVTLANNTLNISSGEVTLSAWVNTYDSSAGWHDVIDNGAYMVGINGGKISYWGGVQVLSNVAVPSGSWQHIAVTFKNNDKIKFYLNGVLKETDDYATTVPTGALGVIGSWDGTREYYKGKIDEVKAYNYIRTEAQIKQDYNAGVAGTAQGGTGASIGEKSDAWLSNGLVGYWKMDEASWNGTDGEVKDASGKNNNGTAVGGATTVGGKFGNGGTFDGSDDTVTVPAITGNSATQTFSSWVYIRGAVSGNQYVIDQGSNNNCVSINNSHFRIITNASYIYDSVATPTINRWYLITKVFDGSRLYLYIDGKLDGSMAASGVTPSSITFGNYGGGGAYKLNGIIDDARLYNRAFSPQEVSQLYDYGPGAVGYWNMDDASGVTAKDLSGSGQDGTLTNGPTWTKGKYNGAVSLDGSNDYVELGTGIFNTLPMGDSSHTIEMWVNYKTLSGSGDEGVLFNYGAAGTNTERGMMVRGGKLLLYYWGNDWNTNYTPPANTWLHITWVSSKDETLDKLYVNGVLKNTRARGTPNTSSGNEHFIGRYAGGGTYSNSIIDDVKVYNYVRTAKQIEEDMNANHPVGGSPVGSQVSYWKFDEGTGTTAYDSIKTDDGDLVDGPAWYNAGKFGKALDLDGTNDRVQALPNAAYKYTGGDLTLSAWVNPDAEEADGGYIITKPWNGNGEYNFGLKYNSNSTLTLSLAGATGWSTTTTDTLTAGTWAHIVVTVEGATKAVKIYKNGNLIKSGTHTIASWTPPSGDSSISMCIGSLFPYSAGWAGDTTFSFNGKIDEMKYYNSLLSPDEVKLDYNQGKSLVMGSVGTADDGKTPSFSAVRGYCPPGNTEGNCGAGQNPAPIGEWKLDEGTGTPTKDTSGNGNDGSLTNGPTWVPGKYNNAVKFDGSDDSVNVVTSASLNAITNGTIEGWFYPTAVSGGIAMSTGGGWLDERMVLHFGYPANNKIKFTVSNASNYETLNSLTDLPLNTWSHIVATADGSKLKIYLNGKLDNSMTQHYTPSLSGVPLYIGMTQGLSPNYFTGKIDDVKVFGYARTAAQVAYDFNRGKPVGWWKLDEGEGSTAYDSSGGGNNGTLTSMDPPTDWVSGKNNGALDFDGSNDFITGTYSNLGITGDAPMSLSAWFKTDSDSNAQTIVVIGDTSSLHNFALYLNSNGNDSVSAEFNGGNGYKSAAGVYSSGQWNHLVAVKTPGAINTTTKLYLNGKELTAATASSSTPAVNVALNYIGQWSNGGGFFDGQIDDVRIYNYALSVEQVKQVFNDGAVNYH